MGRCGSVEEFYRIYCYLPVIGTSEATNYSLFKEGIEPLWEDPSNRQGGRSTLQISGCDLTPILWEKLVVSLCSYASSCCILYRSLLMLEMRSAEYL